MQNLDQERKVVEFKAKVSVVKLLEGFEDFLHNSNGNKKKRKHLNKY